VIPREGVESIKISAIPIAVKIGVIPREGIEKVEKVERG
jgi:hypothetical protein